MASAASPRVFPTNGDSGRRITSLKYARRPGSILHAAKPGTDQPNSSHYGHVNQPRDRDGNPDGREFEHPNRCQIVTGHQPLTTMFVEVLMSVTELVRMDENARGKSNWCGLIFARSAIQ